MSRIRQIKPEFYLDDELAQCSRDARLLFPGLWILADRAGRLEYRPAKIKAQVFPYDDDIDAAKTRELLEQLASRRFILIYEVDGKIVHPDSHVREAPALPPQRTAVTDSWTCSRRALWKNRLRRFSGSF